MNEKRFVQLTTQEEKAILRRTVIQKDGTIVEVEEELVVPTMLDDAATLDMILQRRKMKRREL